MVDLVERQPDCIAELLAQMSFDGFVFRHVAEKARKALRVGFGDNRIPTNIRAVFEMPRGTSHSCGRRPTAISMRRRPEPVERGAVLYR